MSKRVKIYQTVTNTIIKAIEANQIGESFEMPWTGLNKIPTNAKTQKMYRGTNTLILWAHQMQKGFQSGYWGTFKQWQALGARVRKGEKGSYIVFWKTIDVEPANDDEEQSQRMFARWSVVFNADQVDGFEVPTAPKTGKAEQIEAIEQFIGKTGAAITRGGASASYNPKTDGITMPARARFHDTKTSSATEAYYATLLHELTHWTGTSQRLDRKISGRFGDEDYAFEELIAELGAAMLCTTLGMTAITRADHAHYIQNWLKALKRDKRFIFSASSQAQKAVDYLFSLQGE